MLFHVAHQISLQYPHSPSLTWCKKAVSRCISPGIKSSTPAEKVAKERLSSIVKVLSCSSKKLLQLILVVKKAKNQMRNRKKTCDNGIEQHKTVHSYPGDDRAPFLTLTKERQCCIHTLTHSKTTSLVDSARFPWKSRAFDTTSVNSCEVYGADDAANDDNIASCGA